MLKKRWVRVTGQVFLALVIFASGWMTATVANSRYQQQLLADDLAERLKTVDEKERNAYTAAFWEVKELENLMSPTNPWNIWYSVTKPSAPSSDQVFRGSRASLIRKMKRLEGTAAAAEKKEPGT